MCQPKKDGGLNFKNLSFMNEAFHLKPAWEILNNDENIKKLQVKTNNTDSRLWKSIVNLWPHIPSYGQNLLMVSFLSKALTRFLLQLTKMFTTSGTSSGSGTALIAYLWCTTMWIS